MIIISQDKTMMLNFKNIEAIGIGNPLEDKDGKFKILCNTTSDNQYPMAEYETEERAIEILQEIATAQSNFEYFKNATKEGKDYIINLLKNKYEKFDIYEMPKE